MPFLFPGSGPGQAWLIALHSDFLQTVPRDNALAAGCFFVRMFSMLTGSMYRGPPPHKFTPMPHAVCKLLEPIAAPWLARVQLFVRVLRNIISGR